MTNGMECQYYFKVTKIACKEEEEEEEEVKWTSITLLMLELQKERPACAIAEWLYPGERSCIIALIAIGRNTSDDPQMILAIQARASSEKSFRYTKEVISPTCTNCPVLTKVTPLES